MREPVAVVDELAATCQMQRGRPCGLVHLNTLDVLGQLCRWLGVVACQQAGQVLGAPVGCDGRGGGCNAVLCLGCCR